MFLASLILLDKFQIFVIKNNKAISLFLPKELNALFPRALLIVPEIIIP